MKLSRALVALTVLASTLTGQDAPKLKTGAQLTEESTPKNESLVGKTLWFVPNPKRSIIMRFGFQSSMRKLVFYKDKLFPETTTVVEIVEEIKQSSATDYYPLYKVRFKDGSTVYMDHDFPLSEVTPDINLNDSSEYYRAVVDLAIFRDPNPYSKEHFFTSDPSILNAKLEAFKAEQMAEKEAEAAKAKKAAAAWKARGGVKIGMTREQALASNWGKPSKVNKTIHSNGTHEQWVYGGHNYLYFENGILASIQN